MILVCWEYSNQYNYSSQQHVFNNLGLFSKPLLMLPSLHVSLSQMNLDYLPLIYINCSSTGIKTTIDESYQIRKAFSYHSN